VPPRVSDNPEVQQHYLTQLGLSVALVKALGGLWPNLDPERLRETFPAVQQAGSALALTYSSAAISLAADHYDSLREDAVPGRFNTPVIDGPSAVEVEALIEAGTRDLLAGIDTVPDELYLAEIMSQIEAETQALLESVVADAASDELFAAISDDSEAKGWARVVRPGACAFCRMLATRGPVYLSRETANFRAHVAVDGRGGTCHCTVEPLFAKHYEAPAHVRADTMLWGQVTDGLSGADAMYAWRRALEGRTDGKTSRRRRKTDRAASKPITVKGQLLGFEHLTPSQLRHHLSVVTALPDSDYRTRQVKRLTDRLAELAA